MAHTKEIEQENQRIGLDARIENPFNDLQPKEMSERLEAFMEATAIERIYFGHFEKGMFIAQLPDALDDPEPESTEDSRPYGLFLTLEEKKYLKLDQIGTTEDTQTEGDTSQHIKSWRADIRKWNLPRPLWRLVILCAIGAVVQGWDESAINSAQSYYQDAYGIWIDKPTNLSTNTTDPRWKSASPWKVGLVNSAPYLCCVISCWFTYPLNYWFGRRWTIFISCLFSAAFALAQAFADSWQILFAFRFLLGLGIGPKSATVPIYAAEAAPQNVRGGLVMMWQVFTAFGIMCGYIAGAAFQDVLTSESDCRLSSSSHDSRLLGTGCSLKWRLMLGSPMVAPVILMMYIFTQPESPRWLIGRAHKLKDNNQIAKAKKLYQEAFDALLKLRYTKLQAARDMFLLYHQLEKQRNELKKDRENARWFNNSVFELVTEPRNRRAFLASLICMFAQQFCGVNIIVYYSGEVLRRAQGASSNILLYSLGFGIINFLFALPAFYTIDTLGRRSLLLLTFPFLALFQFLTAMAFVGPDKVTGADGNMVHWQYRLAIVGMYLFGVAYSPGEGPVPFVYAAESMPLYIRDIGMGCVTAVNWFFNWLIAITAPAFFGTFGSAGAFLWYAGWCVILWFMIFVFVPETRSLSLEQLDHVFKQPMGRLFKFHREEAKWFWGRYISRSRTEKDRPLLSQFVDQHDSKFAKDE